MAKARKTKVFHLPVFCFGQANGVVVGSDNPQPGQPIPAIGTYKITGNRGQFELLTVTLHSGQVVLARRVHSEEVNYCIFE